MHALLRWLGVLCMIAGLGIEAFGVAEHSRRHEAQAANRPRSQSSEGSALQDRIASVGTGMSAPGPKSTLVVGPYAPALTVGLYAQNRDYHAWAALGQQNTITFSVLTKYTERVTIGFDRPVDTCVGSGEHAPRSLRVFTIAGLPGYSAVTLFSTTKRLAPEGVGAVCRLMQPVSSVRTDGKALAPIDPIIRRHRLEYAAHAALMNAPNALYPRHDPPMKHVPLGLTAYP